MGKNDWKMFQNKKINFVSPSNHVMFGINTNEMSNNFIWEFFSAKGKYSTFTLKLHNGLLVNSLCGTPVIN